MQGSGVPDVPKVGAEINESPMSTSLILACFCSVDRAVLVNDGGLPMHGLQPFVIHL